MESCKKCDRSNFSYSSKKYHEIMTCLSCYHKTFKVIEECCRNPFLIIAQDHKFQLQPRLYRQCLNCFGSLNRNKPLSFAKYGNECEGEFSNHQFELWIKDRSEYGKRLFEEVGEYNYRNSRHYKYRMYLASYEWKKKRKLVLERDNNLCQKCKQKPAQEIHHLTYECLYDEPLEDLISVCNECHEKEHDNDFKLNNPPSDFTIP